MRRALLMVLAVSLTLVAPMSFGEEEVEVEAPRWCDICNETSACYACCRCEGTPPSQCGPGCALAEGKLASTDLLLAPSQCLTSEEIASFEVAGQLEREGEAVDRFLALLDGHSG